MDRGEVRQCDPLGDVDDELSAVDTRDELGELLGVAADVEVDAAHATRLVARGGHPHGGVDDHASVTDQGGQRRELLGGDRREVEQDVDRLGHCGAHVGGGVVDDLVRAELQQVLLVARGCRWR